MRLTDLTREQRAELRQQLEAEDRAEKERARQDREAYKQCVDEYVRSTVRELQVVSSYLMDSKARIFANAARVIDMKNELFNVKCDRQSDTLTTSDGSMTLRLGNRVNEGWDDTVNVGVEKVRAYLRTLARDDNSASLVDTVMGLMAKDRKGNLKAQKVLELERLAVRSGDDDFMDGIRIIREAYRPVATCQFVEAVTRDENGRERSIPLSMSAIE